jgi:hypothetical protein
MLFVLHVFLMLMFSLLSVERIVNVTYYVICVNMALALVGLELAFIVFGLSGILACAAIVSCTVGSVYLQVSNGLKLDLGDRLS